MTDKSPHRSFTVRIPIDLYIEIAEMAREDGVSINHKVGHFIRTGMGETINVNDRIAELIRDRLLPELTKDSRK